MLWPRALLLALVAASTASVSGAAAQKVRSRVGPAAPPAAPPPAARRAALRGAANGGGHHACWCMCGGRPLTVPHCPSCLQCGVNENGIVTGWDAATKACMPCASQPCIDCSADYQVCTKCLFEGATPQDPDFDLPFFLDSAGACKFCDYDGSKGCNTTLGCNEDGSCVACSEGTRVVDGKWCARALPAAAACCCAVRCQRHVPLCLAGPGIDQMPAPCSLCSIKCPDGCSGILGEGGVCDDTGVCSACDTGFVMVGTECKQCEPGGLRMGWQQG